MLKRASIAALVCFLLVPNTAFGSDESPIFGTKGKIKGRIIDSEFNEGLPGANVLIMGTDLGASADIDGEFMIINIPPGTYTVRISMIGYQTRMVEQVIVKADMTTEVPTVTLFSDVLEMGEEIVVVATRELVTKDRTATQATVGAEQLERLPVDGLGEVVELQAGVTTGRDGGIHIRGGRSEEVVFMVDGVAMSDSYSGDPSVQVENASVQELQVISGTFNAEYGRAMSGVVNVVTRDGGERLGGSLTLFAGDYASNKSNEFPHIDSFDPLALSNAQFSLHGSVPGTKKKLRFFATGRLFNDDGYIFATRQFNPSDSSNFANDNPDLWDVQATGDSAVVSMNPTRRATGHAKLSYNFTSTLKLSATALYNNLEARDWSSENNEFAAENEFHDFHRYSLNPDGASTQRRKGLNLIATVDHLINSTTFYTLNASVLKNNATSYVYVDPFDSRYTDPLLLQNVSDNAFYSGGTDPWHSDRTTTTVGFKADVTSQVTDVHQVRGGAELRLLTIEFEEFKLIPARDASGIQIRPFEPAIPARESPFNNAYTKKPREIAVYVQDKIELENIIANVGLRLDVFDPNSKVPTDYSQPANPELLTDATVKTLVSPRIGLAFPITQTGVLHFSYGYFFQMPLMRYLYTNSELEVEIGRLTTLMGNPDLEPTQTAQYEVGLQQQLSSNVAFDFTAYYKDIRNLIGTEIQQLSTGLDRYALYVNRDFATVRGFVFALTERHSRWMSATIDYTFQIAEGNASEPNAAFLDAQANRESEKQLLPLDWDQRHTINLTVNFTPTSSSNINLVGKYGSGLPYTPVFLNIRQAFENTARSPSTLTFDLRANYDFNLGTTRFSVFTTIFNLFDQQNEVIVFQDTGRSGFTIQSQLTGRVRGVNTIDEFFSRPDYWSPPRQIRIGTTIGF